VIIALDATPLTVPTGGVRRYTWELSTALAREFPKDEYHLLSDQPFEFPAAAPPNLRSEAGLPGRLSRRWWLWGVDRAMSQIGAELFHGTDFAVPYLNRRPSVLTLHDLSPWKQQPWQPHAARIRRRTPLLLRLGIATMVITPSEAVRREAIAHFRLNTDRVVAVPLAAGSSFYPARPREWPRPYFIFVGTLEPRKNIGRLVEAWREVRKTYEIDLILAGRIRSDFSPPAPEPGQHLLGAVPEEDLAGWYSGAVACLYTSLYEGFGLPVLEAMSCGGLVITSRDPAIREVSDGCAIHVDAEDTKALAEAMSSAADRNESFAELRERALVRSREFTWERTARQTRAVYEAALKRHAG
jgi:glycosyltransferase involved in cell wall biosynthesis